MTQSDLWPGSHAGAGVVHSYREIVGFGHAVLDAATEQAARAWLLNRFAGDRVFADSFENAPRRP